MYEKKKVHKETQDATDRNTKELQRKKNEKEAQEKAERERLVKEEFARREKQ